MIRTNVVNATRFIEADQKLKNKLEYMQQVVRENVGVAAELPTLRDNLYVGIMQSRRGFVPVLAHYTGGEEQQ